MDCEYLVTIKPEHSNVYDNVEPFVVEAQTLEEARFKAIRRLDIPMQQIASFFNFEKVK